MKGSQLFSCYFSSICSPQQSTPNTREDPTAPGLPNRVFGKGDLALTRPKLLSSLLLELDFARKAMEGGQGVPRKDDCSWCLSTPSFISQGNIYPSGPWLQLSRGTVCWIFSENLPSLSAVSYPKHRGPQGECSSHSLQWGTERPWTTLMS